MISKQLVNKSFCPPCSSRSPQITRRASHRVTVVSLLMPAPCPVKCLRSRLPATLPAISLIQVRGNSFLDETDPVSQPPVSVLTSTLLPPWCHFQKRTPDLTRRPTGENVSTPQGRGGGWGWWQAARAGGSLLFPASPQLPEHLASLDMLSFHVRFSSRPRAFLLPLPHLSTY